MALVRAVGVLTATANLASNDTIFVAGQTYKIEASPATANDVDLGSDLEATLTNLAGAINGNFAVGEAHADTVAAPGVSAVSTATLVTLTADVPGAFGNGIDFREGVDGGSKFSITTAMAGGAGDLGVELDAVVANMQINSQVAALMTQLSPASD